jgi:hypothetical protein
VAVELDVADCEARALIWRVAANAGRATRRARDIISIERAKQGAKLRGAWL